MDGLGAEALDLRLRVAWLDLVVLDLVQPKGVKILLIAVRNQVVHDSLLALRLQDRHVGNLERLLST